MQADDQGHNVCRSGSRRDSWAGSAFPYHFSTSQMNTMSAMNLHTMDEKENAHLLSPDDDEEPQFTNRINAHYNSRSNRLLIAGLAASILVNLILGIFLSRTFQSGANQEERPSDFAGLRRDRSEPFVVRTPYSSSNETLQTQLWRELNVDAGVVALSDEWVAERGLRTAQRFPWDASKGIYILHGYHNLHCVKIIHMALDEYRLKLSQTRDWHHVSHCVDALRRQVICDADDTPRATERRVEVVTGIGQHRKCRSWDALEAWAKQHTACYKRPENPDDDGAEKGLARFKHCPEGSQYVVDDAYVPSEEILEGLPAESIEDFVV